jgi:hypothetical protein
MTPGWEAQWAAAETTLCGGEETCDGKPHQVPERSVHATLQQTVRSGQELAHHVPLVVLAGGGEEGGHGAHLLSTPNRSFNTPERKSAPPCGAGLG